MNTSSNQRDRRDDRLSHELPPHGLNHELNHNLCHGKHRTSRDRPAGVRNGPPFPEGRNRRHRLEPHRGQSARAGARRRQSGHHAGSGGGRRRSRPLRAAGRRGGRRTAGPDRSGPRPERYCPRSLDDLAGTDEKTPRPRAGARSGISTRAGLHVPADGRRRHGADPRLRAAGHVRQGPRRTWRV